MKDMDKARALLEAVRYVVGTAKLNFFSDRAAFCEIGGNSLNLIMILTKLRDLGYHIGRQIKRVILICGKTPHEDIFSKVL